jgi:BlaI family transcriptional regulator, penicillinase repressor
MPDKPASSGPLTPLELEIMNILWDDGSATVAEVQPKLKGDLAYTTVMTMLNILLRKRKVKRVQQGRAFRYRPIVTRQRATGSAVEDLVKRMFGGSTEALLMTLVETRGIGSKDLERLSKIVAEAERKDRAAKAANQE